MGDSRLPDRKTHQPNSWLGLSTTEWIVVGGAALLGVTAILLGAGLIALIQGWQAQASVLTPTGLATTALIAVATTTTRPASAASLTPAGTPAIAVAATPAPSDSTAIAPTAAQTSDAVGAAAATLAPTSADSSGPAATDTLTAVSANVLVGTATPTATFAVTLPPSPAPTATLPPGWIFKGTRRQADTAANVMAVYGLAFNNTGTTQQLSQIGAVFTDTQGQVLQPGQLNDVWPVDVVPNGGWAPFELDVTGLSNPAGMTLNAQSAPSSLTPRQDFEFANQAVFTRPDQYCVRTTFKNNGADLSSYLKVVVVIYDNANSVINFSDTYQPDNLDLVAGGQSLNMDLCAITLGQTVSRYELAGWGR